MATARVLVLRGPGTNCDRETAFAFERAGATAELLHVNRLLECPAVLRGFQILCVPGGFSYGDDVGAGRIMATQIIHHLAEALREFKAAGKLILGICNGFQVLLKAGVLLDPDPENGPPATLTYNDSGKFEDRWVQLAAKTTNCVFLEGIDSMYLPVAHAEGKFVARDRQTLDRLDAAGQLVLRYRRLSAADEPVVAPPCGETVPPEGGTTNGLAGVPYPDNPNGSMADTAGICDSTGRVLGLMPHPERHVEPTHHPRWTRGEAGQEGDGMKVFQNAVAYFG